jgi:hypothetical protein
VGGLCAQRALTRKKKSPARLGGSPPIVKPSGARCGGSKNLRLETLTERQDAFDYAPHAPRPAPVALLICALRIDGAHAQERR